MCIVRPYINIVNLYILLFRDASKLRGTEYRITDVKFFLDIQLFDWITNFLDILLDIWKKISKEKTWHDPLTKDALTKGLLRKSLR